jgi:hypothetical protein
MQTQATPSRWQRFAWWCGRCWEHVLDLALMLWVARVPLSFVALGLLILGTAAQAQDLFVELVGEEVRRIPLFLFLLVFVWAMPTHYAARLLLDTDGRFRAHVDQQRPVKSARCVAAMETWVPRVLGLLPFLAVIIALVRSYVNLPYLQEEGNEGVTDTIGRGLFYLGILVVIAAALFTWYMLNRRRDADIVGLRWVRRIASLAAPLFRLISPARNQPGQPGEEGRDLGRTLLILLFVLFVAVLAFGADWAAEQFPRGLAVPLVLGGWLPLLAYLSALGRRLRAPLILGLTVLFAVLTVFIGDNHSVRRIAAASGAGPDSRMPLDRAVQLWMSENRCSGADCPRPIIVAAAGGASRAGFFTASVLGYLLQEAQYHNLDPNDVRKRLFAISGVSGGSVGAVMAVAALATKHDSAEHPCVQTSFPLWWGQQINNWRDCFEALTSGDFLTPVFIGLAFHDIIRFGWWRDRAAILEEAWERRYDRVVARPDRQAGSRCRGLSCPFLTLRPQPGHWIPLLVLNGTSEGEGNRIVTTVLAPTYTAARPMDCPTAHRQDAQTTCAVLAQTTHFHDLLINDTKPESWSASVQRLFLTDFWKKRQPGDVRLSTAAHNSARFPIISPPGSVRNQKHQIIDRIVDGGYVENYGALSALELALAIRAVNSALAPFVLVISNDPDDPLDPEDDAALVNAAAAQKYQQKRQEQKLRVDVDDSEWLTEFTAPIITFVNTRTARGTHAVAQLRTALFTRMPRCPAHVAHVRVWPQSQEKSKRSRAVSMSWWLSTPIQRHLHQQTEDTKNENDNRATLDLAWTMLDAKSECAQATTPATTAETR